MSGVRSIFLQHTSSMMKDPEQLLDCLDGDEKETVKSIAWELTGSIMTYLKENTVSDGLDVYEKCITKIAELSPPKELYLGILEHFDPCMDSRHVELLIPAISVVVTNLYTEDFDACVTVLETTYSTLSYYIESLNVPNYDNFDPASERKEVFEAEKLLRFVKKYVTVLKPVIIDIYLKKKRVFDYPRFRRHTFQFLCSMLVILGQLDLDISSPVAEDHLKLPVETQQKGQIQELTVPHICFDILNISVSLHSLSVLWNVNDWSLFYPLEERSAAARAEVAKQVERVRACFLFLLFCRKVLYDRFPKVYSGQYYLASTAPAIIALLSCESQVVVWKGLEILSYIFERTAASSLSRKEVLCSIRYLYKDDVAGEGTQNLILAIFKHLINVAILLPSKTVRRKAIQHVTLLLDAFVWEDKYVLLVHMLKTNQHAGVGGVLIGFLKDKLSDILQVSPPENSLAFCDKQKMETLGEIVFELPDGTETDLLEDSDRLMPALNLLRFLLIRDKSNVTRILDNLAKIERNFLKPLRSALDLSRAHYKSELEKIGRSKVPKSESGTDFGVNGTPVPALPPSEQKKSLHAALHTFDMIEVVMVRVFELIDIVSK